MDYNTPLQDCGTLPPWPLLLASFVIVLAIFAYAVIKQNREIREKHER